LARRKRLDRNGRDETRYLRPLEESIARGMTPAEELLERYHGEWGGSVDPIFEEYAY
jgi:glutamate--cysteine ligase